MFKALHSLMSIMSYDHSNFVTELNEFDRSKVREGRSVNISICSMKIKIMLPGNYLKRDIVCIRNKIFNYSFVLKEYIILQATCQIFASPLVRLRQLISHSHSHNIQSCLTYMTHNASLLSMMCTAVRFLYIIMSYDDSHLVTELNEFERSKIRESRTMNILICSMKIKIMLPGNYLERNIVCI
jgi:hypothetical protein